jgi:protoporphyrinogen oxidase
LPIGNTHPQDGLKVGDGTGFKVGIIGAGVAGMFTALIFDYLNETYNNLNVTYEILEADKNRCGGRLYTYTFPPRDKQPAISKHDYYDVGAMRFPHVKGGVMER